MFSRTRIVNVSALKKRFADLRQDRKFSSYGQHNASNGNGLVKSILITNVIVTAAWWSAQNSNNPNFSFMMNHFTVSTRGIFHNHYYHTLVTAIFSHMDPFHLAVNSFVLYSFGTNAIQVLGASRFATLYFGGGLLSSLAFVFWPYVIPKSWPAYRLHNDHPGLGASGAINSLVIWSVLRSPMSMMYFFGVVPIPAFVAGTGLVAMDAMGLYGGSTNNVGNVAHLAGAAFGAAYFVLTRRFRRF